MAAAVLLGGIQLPVSAADTGNGVTVTTRDAFMDALSQKKSPITVTNIISIGKDTDQVTGAMLPVKIPANTVIQGTGSGAICSRAPIQLEGDGVCFKNIELTFESTNALGSTPHREIFLAGHSLTLDNVNTYLPGGGADLGGLGGSEEELLPTVYAGGFANTLIGNHASLTVQNSNDETMFQAIYMSHDEEEDNKVPYRGNATLNLDDGAIVREEVNTTQNSQAEINITGKEGQYAKAREFYGNEHTTLTVSKVSVGEVRNTIGVENIETKATVEDIENIVLKEEACLAPETVTLCNVTLQSGACLDFSGVEDAEISGDFTGESDPAKRGILVLNSNGSLTIGGKVTGTTQFQTYHRSFPGVLLRDKAYISAQAASDTDFVLAQKKIDEGYTLTYDAGKWTAHVDAEPNREIGRIKIVSAPSSIDLRNLKQVDANDLPNDNVYDESFCDENMCFEIIWHDENGQKFSSSEVLDEYNLFYDMGYVVCIPTEYWESNAPEILQKEGWGPPLLLIAPQDRPDKYYLVSYGEVKPGDYTFLFCSENFGNNLTTVEDVKKLLPTVGAEARVIFYDKDEDKPAECSHSYEATVTQKPTCTRAGSQTQTCSLCGHTYIETIPATGKHSYQDTVTEQATCTKDGVRTYICTSCKGQYTEPIPASGHKSVIDPSVPPTETTEGKTEGSHCSVCGEILVAQKPIPATGPGHTHSYQETVTKAATCTGEGIRTYTCSCGHAYTEPIPATDHMPVTDPAVPPTETTEGKTEGSHCSVCGEVLVAQETIPATGKPVTPPAVDPVPPTVTPPVLPPIQPPEEHEHEYKTAVTKEPTCTEAGIMAYACSCGTTYTEEIAPLGHQYKEERIPATVKKAGSVKKVCGVCSQAGETEVIDRIGKIAWSGLEVAYDGREKTPSVSVKDSKGMRLKEGADYQVRYSKGRTNPGVYKAILEFCGDYSGTAAAKMTIRPKAVSLKKVTGKSKSLLVTWKPQNAQIDGYQIRYSTSGKGGNITKTISAGENAEAKTISALKGKAKYYVRIRTYKTVKADGESQRLYSDWSAKKAARTKK